MDETEKPSRLFGGNELLPRVLQLLEAGVDLHDDTYEAQFLDALERVILVEDESFKHDLLCHCTHSLESSKLVNVKFSLSLATSVIKCLPDVTKDIMDRIAIPVVSDNDDSWTFYLQFYQQVFKNLEPGKFKYLGVDFWSKFLLPACIVRKEGLSKYICQDIQNTFTSYVEYFLSISECQDSELKLAKGQLEDNLKQLHLAIGPKILEYLKPLVKKMMTENQTHQNSNANGNSEHSGFKFILDWVNRNMMSVRTNPASNWTYDPKHKHISPNRLYCDLEMESMVQNGKHDLFSSHGFESSKPAVKKRICTAWVRSGSIGPLTAYILIRDFFEKDIWLIQHALALMTEESDLAALCSPLGFHQDLKETLIAIVHKIFQLHQEESEWVTNKTIRVVIQFGKKFFGNQIVPLPRDHLMLLLNIASQKYSGDDFIKGDILLLLSLTLKNGPASYPDCQELIKRLTALARDRSLSLNVRDSALRCLESFLEGSNKSLLLAKQEHLLNDETIDSIIMAVKQIELYNERSLEAPAIAISRHLLGHENIGKEPQQQLFSQSFPDPDVDSLTYCDLYHDDARLEMIRFAAMHWGTLQSSSEIMNIEVKNLQLRMVNFVIGCLRHDSFWEVKRESASFLEAVFEESKKQENVGSRIMYLEEHKFFTGITLGLRDYESPVRERFFSFLKQRRAVLAEFLNVDLVIIERRDNKDQSERKGVKRKHHTELVFDEEEAEDILDVSDKTLVNMLNKRPKTQTTETVSCEAGDIPPQDVSFSEFRDMCTHLTDPRVPEDPVTDLHSIMEDILASSSGEGQIDLVDCY